MLSAKLQQLFESVVKELVTNHVLSEPSLDLLPQMVISLCKNREHGDFACNVAMLMAKTEKKSPVAVASLIVDQLTKFPAVIKRAEVAGPGFINCVLACEALALALGQALEKGASYGFASEPLHKRVLVEFVSANPTGMLHLGHARGAFVGDAISRLLHAAGYEVVREFYVNDTGNQVQTLARTIHKRYRELFGETITIEKNEYPGEYVKDIARHLKERDGDIWLQKDEEEWLLPFTIFGVEENLRSIRHSLEKANIHFDRWFFEHTLHEQGKLMSLIELYKSRNMLYEAKVAEGTEDRVRRADSKAAQYAHMQEGGIFLKTAQFGDDEDRIVLRKDGRPAYLTADLAYHHEKFQQDFDRLINVFGADHAGHVARIKAGMIALGHDVSKLDFVLVQMVRLLRGDKEIRFAKRSGDVISLDELIDEVGVDVMRFVFLMRSAHAQFDFNLDLVQSKSHENPVFYVQYGHARMASLLKKAREEKGLDPTDKVVTKQAMSRLILPEERALLLQVTTFERFVREAAMSLEPHRLIFYCHQVIQEFHGYFTKYRHTERIISDDIEKSLARLALVLALKQTIKNALFMLGIEAPEYMEQVPLEEEIS